MRGKHRSDVYGDEYLGITPAYAGKTDITTPLQSHAPGSPPRMRGKPYPAAFNSEAQGITPAYAGKTGVVGI